MQPNRKKSPVRYSINIERRVLTCDCCNSSTINFYVSYIDREKPVERGKNGEIRPNRFASVCSPEHVLETISKWMADIDTSENQIRVEPGA